MPKEKAQDEVFCRSCGEAIKEKAEICPECGVRNIAQSSSSPSRGSRTSKTAGHDPSNYQTTVSDSWHYGIIGGVIAWVVLLLLTTVNPTGAFEVIFGLIVLVAWIGLPIATYFDMKYVRANSQWNPNTIIWIIAMAIWLINIVSGAVYLYRRHETVGEP